MCDKLLSGDMRQKPTTAYEKLMQAKKNDQNVWLTDDICTRCHKPVSTDGVLVWCTDGCILDAQLVKRSDDKDYMGFISDLIK